MFVILKSFFNITNVKQHCFKRVIDVFQTVIDERIKLFTKLIGCKFYLFILISSIKV